MAFGQLQLPRSVPAVQATRRQLVAPATALAAPKCTTGTQRAVTLAREAPCAFLGSSRTTTSTNRSRALELFKVLSSRYSFDDGESEFGDMDPSSSGRFDSYGRRGAGRGRWEHRPDGVVRKDVEGDDMGLNGRFARPEGLTDAQFDQYVTISTSVDGCKDWRDYARLLAQTGDLMQASHIRLILFRLSRSDVNEVSEEDREGGYNQLLSDLLGHVLALLPRLKPRVTASFLMSLAKLQLYNQEVVEGLVELAQEQLAEMTPKELAHTLWALDTLQIKPGKNWFAQFFQASLPLLEAFQPADYVMTLKSLIKLAVDIPRSWLEEYCIRTAERVDLFRGLDLGRIGVIASVATVCQKMGDFKPPQVWLDAMFTLQKRLAPRDMRIKDVAKMLEVVTLLPADCRPTQAWYQDVYHAWLSPMSQPSLSVMADIALSLGRNLQVPASQVAVDHIKHLVFRARNLLYPDNMAALLYLLAISRAKCSARWVDDVVSAVAPNLPKCGAVGLEMIAYALPLLGRGPRVERVAAEAAGRYKAAVAAQQQQQQQEEEGQQQQQPAEAREEAVPPQQ